MEYFGHFGPSKDFIRQRKIPTSTNWSKRDFRIATILFFPDLDQDGH